jgi:hypothetical protein
MRRGREATDEYIRELATEKYREEAEISIDK